MVEYALIIAAVSVVARSAYNFMGHDIVSMASGVDSSLTSTDGQPATQLSEAGLKALGDFFESFLFWFCRKFCRFCRF